MAKGQGNISVAIEWLNKYLQMYKQGAFCYEELIIAQPAVSLYHLAYGDVLYTLGGLQNLQTAKKYYSSTIDLRGGKNTRALLGICLFLNHLSRLEKERRDIRVVESIQDICPIPSMLLAQECACRNGMFGLAVAIRQYDYFSRGISVLELDKKAPRTSRGSLVKGARSFANTAAQQGLIAHWQGIVKSFGNFLNTLKENHVPPFLYPCCTLLLRRE